jgi:hypothetical protein
MSNNNGANYTFNLKGKIDPSFNKARQSVGDLKDKIDKSEKKGFNLKISDDFKNKFREIGESMKGATEKLSGFASEIPIVGGALSSITSKLGPIGLAITATVGAFVALGTHLVGVTKELEEVRSKFALFVKDAKDLDIVTAKAQSLKKVFGTSEEEIAKASNTLQKEFGISSVEAMEKLQKALIATNGKLELGDINEFSNQIKSIGGNADDLLTTMSTSVQQGLFSNKALDAQKDFGKNIRSGSESVKELLKTVGKSNLVSDVQKGIITQQEAYKSIYKDFDTYTLKQQQELTTLLGGGGEALGARGIQALAEMNGSLDDLVKNAGAYADHNAENLRLQEELAKSQLESTNRIAPLLKKIDLFTTKIQIGFQKFINPLVDFVFDLGEEFGRLFKGSEIGFGLIFDAVSFLIYPIKNAMTGIKALVGLWVSTQIGIRRLIDLIKNGLGKAFEWVFGDGSISKIKSFFANIIDFASAKFSQFVEVAKTTFEGIRKLIELDFSGANNSFAKAKGAGKELFSNSRKVSKSDVSADAEKKNNTTGESDLDKQTKNNMSNAVTGASSDVRNITINLEALQKISEQIINNGGDVKSMEALLQQALMRVVNDANQK